MASERALNVLIRAKQLISRPGGWVRGIYFKLSSGNTSCSNDAEFIAKASPEAGTSYCAFGAVIRAEWEQSKKEGSTFNGNIQSNTSNEVNNLMYRAFWELPDRAENTAVHCPASYSNNMGQEGAARLFCKAIELAAEEDPNDNT